MPPISRRGKMKLGCGRARGIDALQIHVNTLNFKKNCGRVGILAALPIPVIKGDLKFGCFFVRGMSVLAVLPIPMSRKIRMSFVGLEVLVVPQIVVRGKIIVGFGRTGGYWRCR